MIEVLYNVTVLKNIVLHLIRKDWTYDKLRLINVLP